MTAFPSVDLLGWSATKIRSRLAQPTLKHLGDHYVSQTRDLLNPAAPHFLDYPELEKPVWRSRNGVFIIPQSLQMLALTGILTQETRFAETARDILLTIIDHQLADSASVAWGVSTTGWRHGEGHDKFLLALGVWSALEFAGQTFDATHRDKVRNFLKESLRISLELTRTDNANITNNRGVRGLCASALWALLLEHFEPCPEREAILTRAWIGLEKHLYFVFDAQGAAYEGPAYAGNTLGSLALMAEILHRNGAPDLLRHRAFERHPRYLAYELVPGQSTVNNLNDSAATCGSVSGCLHWMNQSGGEVIHWLARQLDLTPERLNGGAFAQTPAIRDFLNFLLWWDDDAPVRSPEELNWMASGHFPIRGVSSHRTGWASSDLLVSHFCGRQEVLCHRQGDQNHVALYAGGERLLVDAGYGDEHKDMNQKMNRWFGLTEAHNCVLIDGQNQRGVLESPGWSEGEMLNFSQSPQGSTSAGDASAATGIDHRIRESLRRVTLHRDTPVPAVTILDCNERDGNSFLTEILWHTDARNDWTVHANGGMIHSQTIDCHAFIFNLRGEPFEIFREEGFGRPRLRVRSETVRSEFLTLFIPLAKGEAAPIVRLNDATLEIETTVGNAAIPIQR